MYEEVRNLWKTGDYRAVAAFTVPLGYFLSTVVFSRFWSNISALM